MNALNIKGLTKVYKGGTRALNGINLQVKQGDFLRVNRRRLALLAHWLIKPPVALKFLNIH